MTIRHYEIQTPLPDFQGEIVGTQFVDGRALVSFEDTPAPGISTCVGEIGSDQPGRSLVLYARRLHEQGYRVTEVDAQGKPLATDEVSR